MIMSAPLERTQLSSGGITTCSIRGAKQNKNKPSETCTKAYFIPYLKKVHQRIIQQCSS